jgi:hypothetical protein
VSIFLRRTGVIIVQWNLLMQGESLTISISDYAYKVCADLMQNKVSALLKIAL